MDLRITQLSAIAIFVSAVGLHSQSPFSSAASHASSLNASIQNTGQQISIDPRPLLDLGGDRGDPASELTLAVDNLVARLSDGRIVVSDNDHLKLFTRDGRLLRRLGRGGQGPGEFGSIINLCVGAGDTIMASDRSRKVVYFSPSGEMIRSLVSERGVPARNSCLRNGDFLVPVAAANPGSVHSERDANIIDRVADVWLVTPDGRDVRSVGRFADGIRNPWIPGVGNFVVRNDRIFVGNGSEPEVKVYSLDGVLLRTVRWQQTRIPVTDSLVTELARGSVPRGSESAVAAQLGRARSMARPVTLPYYDYLLLDGRGRLWVRGYHLSSPRPVPWMVFDSTGAPLGRITLPNIQGATGIGLQSVGTDEVAIRWRDSSGFVHLTLHAVR